MYHILVVGLGLLLYSGSWKSIMFLVGLLVTYIIYLLYCQENLLYVPVPMPGMRTPEQNPEGFRSPADMGLPFEDVYFTTEDGIKLHAWFIPAPDGLESSAPTIVFCHENAGNIGFRVPYFHPLNGKAKVNIFAFDWRGYGNSEGKPSEPGFMLDVEAACKWVRDSEKCNKNNIFLLGRSLGGAATIQHAAKSPEGLRGVILENTFLSIPRLLDSLMPWLAFEFVKTHLLRLSWKSIDFFPKIKVPVLLMSGRLDEIIPSSHMDEFHRIAKKNDMDVTMHQVPSGTHNDTFIKICWSPGNPATPAAAVVVQARIDVENTLEKMLMRVECASVDTWLPERLEKDLRRCKAICNALDIARFGYVTDVVCTFASSKSTSNEDSDTEVDAANDATKDVDVVDNAQRVEEELDWLLGYLYLVHRVDYYRGCWEFEQNPPSSRELTKMKIEKMELPESPKFDRTSDESEYLEILIPTRTLHVRPKRPSSLSAHNPADAYRNLAYEDHWDEFLLVPCDGIPRVRVITSHSKESAPHAVCTICNTRFSSQSGGDTIVEHFTKYHRTKKNLNALELQYDVLRCRLMYGLAVASKMCISKQTALNQDSTRYGKLLSSVRRFRDQVAIDKVSKMTAHNQRNRGKTMDHSNDLVYQRVQAAKPGRKRNGRRDRGSRRLHAEDIRNGRVDLSRSRSRRRDRHRSRSKRRRSRSRRSRSRSKRRSRSRSRRR